MFKIGKALEWLDVRSDWVFLPINSAVGAFVLLAHGGALVLTRLGKAPTFERSVPLLLASVSVALLVIVSGLVGLCVRRVRSMLLKIHAIVLSIFSTCALGVAAYWVVAGIPTGNFSWSPGFLTMFSVYPAYLLRRSFWSRPLSTHPLLAMLPLWVGCAAFVLDCGVGIRFALGFSSFFSGR